MISFSENNQTFTKEKCGQRDSLISQYLFLVPAAVSKYHGLDNWDELISVGAIGLIKAVDTFDQHKGCPLDAYAWICITNEINMYVRKELTYRSRISEISAPDCFKALDKPGICKQDPVYEEVLERLEQEQLETCFHSLSQTEQEILRLRFGLNEAEAPCSQAEIADHLGFSQSYASRMIRKCLLSLYQKMYASYGS